MKNIFLLTTTIMSMVGGCDEKTVTNPPVVEPKLIELRVNLNSKSASTVTGSATFTEKNGTVTLIANVTGMTQGEHGIHIHDKSDCSAADGTSAGGHWNPNAVSHGKWGSTTATYHKGDIGNITANADGNGTITFSTNEWCIGCGDVKKDIVGKGIIIHDKPDDYSADPAAPAKPTNGNAGARFACGGIIK